VQPGSAMTPDRWVCRVGVTKGASALRARKLVHYRRGDITVLDRADLLGAACGCYQATEALYDRIDVEYRLQLEQAGTPVGPNDLLIAAHAVNLGLTLVTEAVDEFMRVAGLRVENRMDNASSVWN